jgi:hypothetical protein
MEMGIIESRNFKVEQYEDIDGEHHCLRSSKNFKIGQPIHILQRNIIPERDKYSIQLKKGEDIIHVIDPHFKYCNHSFTPNCAITPAGVVYALVPIQDGDELTFNYLTTEDEISHPFVDHKTNIQVK